MNTGWLISQKSNQTWPKIPCSIDLNQTTSVLEWLDLIAGGDFGTQDQARKLSTLMSELSETFRISPVDILNDMSQKSDQDVFIHFILTPQYLDAKSFSTAIDIVAGLSKHYGARELDFRIGAKSNNVTEGTFQVRFGELASDKSISKLSPLSHPMSLGTQVSSLRLPNITSIIPIISSSVSCSLIDSRSTRTFSKSIALRTSSPSLSSMTQNNFMSVISGSTASKNLSKPSCDNDTRTSTSMGSQYASLGPTHGAISRTSDKAPFTLMSETRGSSQVPTASSNVSPSTNCTSRPWSSVPLSFVNSSSFKTQAPPSFPSIVTPTQNGSFDALRNNLSKASSRAGALIGFFSSSADGESTSLKFLSTLSPSSGAAMVLAASTSSLMNSSLPLSTLTRSSSRSNSSARASASTSKSKTSLQPSSTSDSRVDGAAVGAAGAGLGALGALGAGSAGGGGGLGAAGGAGSGASGSSSEGNSRSQEESQQRDPSQSLDERSRSITATSKTSTPRSSSTNTNSSTSSPATFTTSTASNITTMTPSRTTSSCASCTTCHRLAFDYDPPSNTSYDDNGEETDIGVEKRGLRSRFPHQKRADGSLRTYVGDQNCKVAQYTNKPAYPRAQEVRDSLPPAAPVESMNAFFATAKLWAVPEIIPEEEGSCDAPLWDFEGNDVLLSPDNPIKWVIGGVGPYAVDVDHVYESRLLDMFFSEQLQQLKWQGRNKPKKPSITCADIQTIFDEEEDPNNPELGTRLNVLFSNIASYEHPDFLGMQGILNKRKSKIWDRNFSPRNDAPFRLPQGFDPETCKQILANFAIVLQILNHPDVHRLYQATNSRIYQAFHVIDELIQSRYNNPCEDPIPPFLDSDGNKLSATWAGSYSTWMNNKISSQNVKLQSTATQGLKSIPTEDSENIPADQKARIPQWSSYMSSFNAKYPVAAMTLPAVSDWPVRTGAANLQMRKRQAETTGADACRKVTTSGITNLTGSQTASSWVSPTSIPLSSSQVLNNIGTSRTTLSTSQPTSYSSARSSSAVTQSGNLNANSLYPSITSSTLEFPSTIPTTSSSPYGTWSSTAMTQTMTPTSTAPETSTPGISDAEASFIEGLLNGDGNSGVEPMNTATPTYSVTSSGFSSAKTVSITSVASPPPAAGISDTDASDIEGLLNEGDGQSWTATVGG